MWDKIVFLTTLAGATCLMRASVGAIMSTPEGERYVNDLLDECAAIARAAGHALSETQLASSRAILTNRTSPLMASMLRDVEAGRPTEADHILGDMLAKVEDRLGVERVEPVAYTSPAHGRAELPGLQFTLTTTVSDETEE